MPFGDFFDVYGSTRPLIISGYGVDAFNSGWYTGGVRIMSEDQPTQVRRRTLVFALSMALSRAARDVEMFGVGRSETSR